MIDRYLAEVEQALRALRPLIGHEALTIERPEGVELAFHLHTETGVAESPPVTLPAVLSVIQQRLLTHLGTP